MAAAESGDAGELLIFLDEDVGLARDFLVRDFDFDFADGAGRFSGTQRLPFESSTASLKSG